MLKKKILAGALVGALAVFGAFGLVACGGGNDAPADQGAADFQTLTEGKIVFATSPDYPPFENLEGDEYVGFEIDLAKALGEKMGLEVEFKNLQFDAIIPAIVSGGQADVGISGFSVTPERAEEIDFTTSYYTDDMAVVVKKGGAITEENVDEELNKDGVVIAVQSGTTGEDSAKENYGKATVKGYGNANDTFAALDADQASAVCTNLAVANQMIKSYTDAVIVKQIATGEDYAMVVSKDNPALSAAINAALEEMQADGTIKGIFG